MAWFTAIHPSGLDAFTFYRLAATTIVPILLAVGKPRLIRPLFVIIRHLDELYNTLTQTMSRVNLWPCISQFPARCEVLNDFYNEPLPGNATVGSDG